MVRTKEAARQSTPVDNLEKKTKKRKSSVGKSKEVVAEKKAKTKKSDEKEKKKTKKSEDKKSKDKKSKDKKSKDKKSKDKQPEVKSTAPTRVHNFRKRGIRMKRRMVRRALLASNIMPMAQVRRSFKDRFAQDFPTRKARTMEKGAMDVLKQYLEFKLSDMVERHLVPIVASRRKWDDKVGIRNTTLMPEMVHTAVYFASGAPGVTPDVPRGDGTTFHHSFSPNKPKMPSARKPKAVAT
jgi:hypothetical protein